MHRRNFAYGVPKIVILITLFMLTFTIAQATSRLVFSNEDPEERGNEFILDVNNDYDTYALRFGDDIDAAITFDENTDLFSINRSVNLQGNELQNFQLEALSSPPSCTTSDNGRMYFDTSDSHTYVCNGSSWSRIDEAPTAAGLTVDSTVQTSDYNALAVNTINVLSAMSPNRPIDKVLVVKTLGDASLKTQLATDSSVRYYRLYQANSWSEWQELEVKKYRGYRLQSVDQTDGTASYLGRTRKSDSKWLITLSVPGGFTYAQEENNVGINDFATAWANRASLIYSANFTP